jgi:hypothetical protein
VLLCCCCGEGVSAASGRLLELLCCGALRVTRWAVNVLRGIVGLLLLLLLLVLAFLGVFMGSRLLHLQLRRGAECN